MAGQRACRVMFLPPSNAEHNDPSSNPAIDDCGTSLRATPWGSRGEELQEEHRFQASKMAICVRFPGSSIDRPS